MKSYDDACPSSRRVSDERKQTMATPLDEVGHVGDTGMGAEALTHLEEEHGVDRGTMKGLRKGSPLNIVMVHKALHAEGYGHTGKLSRGLFG